MLRLQQVDGHRTGGGVNDPVFPDPGALVEKVLCEPVAAAGGGGEDFQHKVRGAVYPLPVHFLGVTDHQKVRLDHVSMVSGGWSFAAKRRTSKGAG